MTKPVTIKNKESTKDILDFKFLKDIGLGQIQNLSGKIWTDYNTHDPGITILEVLSYALTELGYRSRHSVNDLLSKGIKTKSEKVNDTLIDSSDILCSSPLTINDYRKLIFDIDGVKNVTIIKSREDHDHQGIYDISIELFSDYNDDFNRMIISQEVSLLLNEHRNLCEDFNEIKFLEYDPVSFNIDVEVSGSVNPSELFYEIYICLVEYLSPGIKFHDLVELLDKGMTVDEIFNGPLLKNGFIINDELESLELKDEIYTSDIIHFLMDLEGISWVKKVKIIDSDNKEFNWSCKVKANKAPKLDIENTKIRLYNLSSLIDLKEYIDIDADRIYKKEYIRSSHKRLTFPKKTGEYRNLSDYDTIQNDFPDTYGIGDVGLPHGVSNKRKAQAKQLKAYLLIFEQVLADYFSQLENLDRLYSTEMLNQTYFTQPLFNIPGVEYLFKPFTQKCFEESVDMKDSMLLKKLWTKYKADYEAEFNKIISEIIESEFTFYDRRNRLLDHLMSRFGLNYSQYQFYYVSNEDFREVQIRNKTNILDNISQLSKERGKAFNNIYAEFFNEFNISGFEYRLNKLLGINNNSKTFLSNFADNGVEIEEIFGNEFDNNDKKSEEFNIVFYQQNKKTIINNLFKYGTLKDNYVIKESGENMFSIDLLDKGGKSIAKLKEVSSGESEVEKILEEFVGRIKDLEAKSECIYIIEHLLLRPLHQINSFGFSLLDDKGTPCFRSLNFVTYDQRTNLIDNLLVQALNRNNYTVVNEGINQYKLLINDDENKELIKGVKYYGSIEEAEEAIEFFIFYFKDIYEEVIDRNDVINYYTSYLNTYQEIEDPFSFIITVVLPLWPLRFQEERFRMHIENVIYKEAPSHIIPNIKWKGIDEMSDLIKLHEQILIEKFKKTPDMTLLSDLTDKLLGRIT